MPPIEISDKIFETNSSKFINDLRTKGYKYINNSNSYYGNTFLLLVLFLILKHLREKIKKSLIA